MRTNFSFDPHGYEGKTPAAIRTDQSITPKSNVPSSAPSTSPAAFTAKRDDKNVEEMVDTMGSPASRDEEDLLDELTQMVENPLSTPPYRTGQGRTTRNLPGQDYKPVDAVPGLDKIPGQAPTVTPDVGDPVRSAPGKRDRKEELEEEGFPGGGAIVEPAWIEEAGLQETFTSKKDQMLFEMLVKKWTK